MKNKKTLTFLLIVPLIILLFSGNAYAAGTAIPGGTAIVYNGWLFDLINGSGTYNFETADFWWGNIASNNVRYLVPKNGAKFTIMGNIDLETVNCPSFASISSEKINGSINNNQIPTGTVICVQTFRNVPDAYETYAVRIDSYGDNLAISWVIPQIQINNYAATSPLVFIFINSIPQGAQILIDGKNSGELTPDKLYFDREGEHTYELSLDEYQPYQEKFYISEPMRRDVIMTLQTSTFDSMTSDSMTSDSMTSDSMTSDSNIPVPTTPIPTTPIPTTPIPTTPIPIKQIQTPKPTPIKQLQTPKSTPIEQLQTPKPTSIKQSQTPEPTSIPYYPTPTSTPGFLALSLLMAIFFVYFFMFKNKRY